MTNVNIIDRLIESYGVKNDSNLSKLLKKSRTTISGWRTKNSAPDEISELAAIKNGYNFEWIKTGEGEKRPPISPTAIGEINEAQATYHSNPISLTRDEYTLLIMFRKLPPARQDSLIKQVSYQVAAMDIDECGE